LERRLVFSKLASTPNVERVSVHEATVCDWPRAPIGFRTGPRRDRSPCRLESPRIVFVDLDGGVLPAAQAEYQVGPA
jgi:hypothetical protein